MVSDKKAAALASIDAISETHRAASAELLEALIGAGRSGEATVQAIVETELSRAGCAVRRLRYRPVQVPVTTEFATAFADAHDVADSERESVVGVRSGRDNGSGHGRSLILFAHPDSEPAIDIGHWHGDPFVARCAGGRIHGWGVADDLAGVAMMVSALSLIERCGIALAADVTVASTPSKRHARGVAAVLHGGITADAAVYLHPAESGAGLREVKAVSSGMLEFEISVGGQLPDTNEPGHTIFAHRAVNPIDKAVFVHSVLRDIGEARAHRVRHRGLDNRVGRATNILVADMRCSGSQGLNRLPTRCVITGTISFPPTELMANVQAEIESELKTRCAADAWLAQHPPELKWLSGVPAAEVDSDHPLRNAIAHVIERTIGQNPSINPLHTASDIRIPIAEFGIPTIGLGPLCGDLTQNGRHDEWVDMNDYRASVSLLAALIVEWCGVA